MKTGDLCKTVMIGNYQVYIDSFKIIGFNFYENSQSDPIYHCVVPPLRQGGVREGLGDADNREWFFIFLFDILEKKR